MLILVYVGGRPIVEGICIVWIEVHDLCVILDCPVIFTNLWIVIPPITIGVYIIRIETDGPVVVLNC